MTLTISKMQEHMFRQSLISQTAAKIPMYFRTADKKIVSPRICMISMQVVELLRVKHKKLITIGLMHLQASSNNNRRMKTMKMALESGKNLTSIRTKITLSYLKATENKCIPVTRSMY